MTVASGPARLPRSTATVAAGRDEDGSSQQVALELALEQSCAEDTLALAAGGRNRGACAVVVRPALAPGASPEEPPLSYADPLLVESLVAWLRGRGWHDVTIAVSGPGGRETALQVGYTSEVLDLASDVAPYHYGGLIGEHDVATAWRDADLRILVGKARTDRQLLYAGAMIGALGCVPDSDRMARELARAHDLGECVSDILEKLPVAFGVVDAWCAADGSGPPASPGQARKPGAVLASADLLALDWVLGELMDLDGPELGPLIREALWRRDPIEIKRRGDLTEWDPWRNPGALRAVLSDLGAGHWWGRLSGSPEVPWTAR